MGTTLPFPIIRRDTTLSSLFSISAGFLCHPCQLNRPRKRFKKRRESQKMTALD